MPWLTAGWVRCSFLAADEKLRSAATVRKVLSAGIVLRSQREESESPPVAHDRAIWRVLAGKMHLEWRDLVAADSSAAAHENLKLVHIMKMRPDHASVAAFRQERLRIDRARCGRHEVRSPGEFSVRQNALGARCFDILESHYIRHVVLPIDEAAILTPRQAARQNRRVKFTL